jgi:hypothetical protein
MRALLLVAAIAFVGTACGTEELTCGEGGAPLYPLEEGAWWRYGVQDTQSGDPECPDKLVSIGAPDYIPLRPEVWAYPALSEQPGKHAIRWQEVTPDGSVRRHVDEWFDDDGSRLKIIYYCPYQTRVDDGAHTCAGAAWSETWRELQVIVDDPAAGDACAAMAVGSDDCAHGAVPTGCSIEPSPNDGLTEKVKSWEVVAIDESITVPAGTYSTLHLRTDDTEDGETNWWWARGVGKITEQGSESQEQLDSYCLPSGGCDAGAPEDLDAGCGE